jgi:hypothetical protein
MMNAFVLQTEDIALLCILVEELQPRPSQFTDERGCLDWVSQYAAIAPVVLRILGDSEAAFLSPPGQESGEREEGREEEGEGEMSAGISLPYGMRCRQQLAVIRYRV